MNAPTSTGMTAHEQIRAKILEVEEALLKDNPLLPQLLRTIHKALQADSDVVTLMAEEECSIIVRGLEKQTATTIASEAMAKSTKKAMKNMGTEDI